MNNDIETTAKEGFKVHKLPTELREQKCFEVQLDWTIGHERFFRKYEILGNRFYL